MEAVYLIRHGQTHWNAQERMQGWLDSPLTDAGRRHAEDNAGLVAREGVDALLVSPLGRTRQTAAIINAALDLPIRFDDRLKERNCGAWEGLTLAEIERQWPEEIAARRADPFHHRPPGGENLPDMVARVADLLDEVLSLPEPRVAIVSHGMIGRAMLTYLLGLAPPVANQARQPNDVVYRITVAGGTRHCTHFRAGVGPVAGFFSGA